jgi:hypothetical protein
MRRALPRRDLGRDRLRFLLRGMEEPRQHLRSILRSQDLRELRDAGETEPSIAQRLDHLREALDELRGCLPVERRPRREPELPVQEVEEARIAELGPKPAFVEGCESDEKGSHGRLLAPEEIEEAGGEFACAGHARIVSRDFDPS